MKVLLTKKSKTFMHCKAQDLSKKKIEKNLADFNNRILPQLKLRSAKKIRKYLNIKTPKTGKSWN